MSNWFKEAKEVKIKQYSNYCKQCKLQGITPIPFCNFVVELKN